MPRAVSKQTKQQAPATHPVATGVVQHRHGSCQQHGLAGEECETGRKKGSILDHHPMVPFSLSEPHDTDPQPLRETRFGLDFSRVQARSRLTIGQPNNRYETQAQDIAEEVTRISTPEPRGTDALADRSTGDCIQRWRPPQTTSSGQTVLSPRFDAVLPFPRRSGSPLPAAARSYFEPRFGRDFSRVRVHTDRTAVDLAAALQARAFTLENHIAFAAGELAPTTARGRYLLAHELAHVIQQGDRPGHLQRQCLTGPVCGFEPETETETERTGETRSPAPVRPVTIDIPGDPGRFGAEATQARDEARRQRLREEAESEQPSRQARPATHITRFGEREGLDMTRLGGVFIDLDIRIEGGYACRCSACPGFSGSFAGEANARCVFVPDHRETEAQRFLETDARRIGERSRENWRLMMLELLTHEIQHGYFRLSIRPDDPAGRCSLETVVSRQSGRRYDVRHMLSELSAILSEFRVRYRARPPSTLEDMDWWFNSRVSREGESVGGIMTILRCVCDCDEVNEYVGQTLDFTVESWGWTAEERTYVNQALQRQEGLDWPIVPRGDSLAALRRALEARRPGRRHRWTLTPGLTTGVAQVGGGTRILERLGMDFGIPLDQARQWLFEAGIHETYIGAGAYQSFLTGVRAALSFTTPGTGTSFRVGVFGELGGAAVSTGMGESYRPDVYGQGGMTLGLTLPAETWGRMSLSAEILAQLCHF